MLCFILRVQYWKSTALLDQLIIDYSGSSQVGPDPVVVPEQPQGGDRLMN